MWQDFGLASRCMVPVIHSLYKKRVIRITKGKDFGEELLKIDLVLEIP